MVSKCWFRGGVVTQRIANPIKAPSLFRLFCKKHPTQCGTWGESVKRLALLSPQNAGRNDRFGNEATRGFSIRNQLNDFNAVNCKPLQNAQALEGE